MRAARRAPQCLAESCASNALQTLTSLCDGAGTCSTPKPTVPTLDLANLGPVLLARELQGGEADLAQSVTGFLNGKPCGTALVPCQWRARPWHQVLAPACQMLTMVGRAQACPVM